MKRPVNGSGIRAALIAQGLLTPSEFSEEHAQALRLGRHWSGKTLPIDTPIACAPGDLGVEQEFEFSLAEWFKSKRRKRRLR